MIDSAEISDCFGFTKEEVYELCSQYGMDFNEMKEWYDGYHLVSKANGQHIEYSIYSPNSIVESIMRGDYDGYWNQTETYEALQKYIQFNMDGLKDAIVKMVAGNEVTIDTGAFKNDMYEFHSRDEVLTLLIHLGYLTYSRERQAAYIPNKEVTQEFLRSINHSKEYVEIADSIRDSKELVEALWAGDELTVAEGIEKVHQSFPPIQYNSELALSCVIELAFYFAREYYTILRELPTGKGYADICYIPKPRYASKPAVIIELKWNQSVKTAIDQIKEKNYPKVLDGYEEDLLICGINYDKKSKKHDCRIEKL
ncbi:N-acetylhexosamine 1-kinase [Lachnospiraceae bacterium TWA4]|nr:N-acetylhexosamine 1-kinase [Lachnospiraceae bacterium TWA4]